nr:MAG TPA: tail assembly chaperone [Caudoviricetes sp.]
MSKLKLAHAATFKAEVKIPTPAGEPVAVEFEFVWLNRKAMAEFADDCDRKDLSDADLVLKITKSWGFEDEFNAENMAYLLDEYPSAGVEILSAFYQAYNGAREKN